VTDGQMDEQTELRWLRRAESSSCFCAKNLMKILLQCTHQALMHANGAVYCHFKLQKPLFCLHHLPHPSSSPPVHLLRQLVIFPSLLSFSSSTYHCHHFHHVFATCPPLPLFSCCISHSSIFVVNFAVVSSIVFAICCHCHPLFSLSSSPSVHNNQSVKYRPRKFSLHITCMLVASPHFTHALKTRSV